MLKNVSEHANMPAISSRCQGLWPVDLSPMHPAQACRHGCARVAGLPSSHLLCINDAHFPLVLINFCSPPAVGNAMPRYVRYQPTPHCERFCVGRGLGSGPPWSWNNLPVAIIHILAVDAMTLWGMKQRSPPHHSCHPCDYQQHHGRTKANSKVVPQRRLSANCSLMQRSWAS